MWFTITYMSSICSALSFNGVFLALPKFYTHPVSMTVDEGGVARFQCEINGVPEASITWERNRVPLNTTNNR